MAKTTETTVMIEVTMTLKITCGHLPGPAATGTASRVTEV
jgi:hypothetical protein